MRTLHRLSARDREEERSTARNKDGSIKGTDGLVRKERQRRTEKTGMNLRKAARVRLEICVRNEGSRGGMKEKE